MNKTLTVSNSKSYEVKETVVSPLWKRAVITHSLVALTVVFHGFSYIFCLQSVPFSTVVVSLFSNAINTLI